MCICLLRIIRSWLAGTRLVDSVVEQLTVLALATTKLVLNTHAKMHGKYHVLIVGSSMVMSGYLALHVYMYVHACIGFSLHKR